MGLVNPSRMRAPPSSLAAPRKSKRMTVLNPIRLIAQPTGDERPLFVRPDAGINDTCASGNASSPMMSSPICKNRDFCSGPINLGKSEIRLRPFAENARFGTVVRLAGSGRIGTYSCETAQNHIESGLRRGQSASPLELEEAPQSLLVIHRHMQIGGCNAHVRVPNGVADFG